MNGCASTAVVVPLHVVLDAANGRACCGRCGARYRVCGWSGDPERVQAMLGGFAEDHELCPPRDVEEVNGRVG